MEDWAGRKYTRKSFLEKVIFKLRSKDQSIKGQLAMRAWCEQRPQGRKKHGTLSNHTKRDLWPREAGQAGSCKVSQA